MSAIAPFLGDLRLTVSATTPQPVRLVKGVPGPENFEQIVDDYQRRLYGFALRMTGNREDAEEIVQDAFVRAYRALAKMDREQRAELRLQPWLYTITLNVTRNRLRSKRPTNVASTAPRTWCWSNRLCCNCRCTCVRPRRCASSKVAAIPRSRRSSISRLEP
jgi:hypothetical protein